MSWPAPQVRRARVFAAHAVAAVLVIGSAGCGADLPHGPGWDAAFYNEEVEGPVIRPGDPVEFIASEFEFMPGELVVEAGSYSGQLINDGSIVHNITFSNGESFEAGPGESISIEFSALDEDVTYVCSIEGHADAGMIGVIHTRSSAAGETEESE
jgi:plastocyanin